MSTRSLGVNPYSIMLMFFFRTILGFSFCEPAMLSTFFPLALYVPPEVS